VVAVGCNSNSSKSVNIHDQKTVATSAVTNSRADIDLNCISTNIQNQEESFNYTFTVV
jgi:hypothetical protein